MSIRIYKLYALVSSSTNAAASVIVQRRGKILGVYWSATANTVTDNDDFTTELSFGSTAQTTTNDTLGPICSISAVANFVTSGLSQSGTATFIGPLMVPVNEGDRLYLNQTNHSGSASVRHNVYVYVQE